MNSLRSFGIERLPIRRALTIVLGGIAMAIALRAPAQVHETKAPQILEGRLVSLPGTGPALSTRGKDHRLSAKTSYVFHTLQDKRLAGHEVRLEGTTAPDGSFEVSRLFTVRQGKLFRVRYFCDVCNIEALEPGICVCCQQPTELQEIPVAELGK